MLQLRDAVRVVTCDIAALAPAVLAARIEIGMAGMLVGKAMA